MGVYWLRSGRFAVWAKRAVIPDVTLNAGPTQAPTTSSRSLPNPLGSCSPRVPTVGARASPEYADPAGSDRRPAGDTASGLAPKRSADGRPRGEIQASAAPGEVPVGRPETRVRFPSPPLRRGYCTCSWPTMPMLSWNRHTNCVEPDFGKLTFTVCDVPGMSATSMFSLAIVKVCAAVPLLSIVRLSFWPAEPVNVSGLKKLSLVSIVNFVLPATSAAGAGEVGAGDPVVALAVAVG